MTPLKDIPKSVRITKGDAIEMYAHLLLNPNFPDEMYKTLNSLIISRWSMSGLNDIKERAWKIIENK